MLKKISNGHISATGRPIHFMFCSRMGFSGTADLMALFPVRTNPRWRPPPSWIISNGHISTTAHDLLIARIARAVIFAIAQLSSFFCDWWLWSLVNFLSRFGLPASGLPSPLCATFRFNKLQLVDIRKKEKNKRLNNLIYFLCSNGMTANFTAPWQSCYRVCLLSNNL